MTTNFSTKLEETITNLTPRLQRKARKYAASAPGQDADDIYQEMMLSLIERANEEPEFLDQTEAYITNHCEWTGGRHVATKSRIYSKYVEAEPETTNDEGEAIDWVETLIFDNGNNPERQLLRKEQTAKLQEAIKTLGQDNQMVVKMLFEGRKQKEIAAAMHITPAAVSQRKTYIASQLRAAL